MGINLMYANLPVNGENYPLEIPPLLEKGEVDGLLLAGAFIDENLSRILEHRSYPLVLIDSYSDECIFNAVLSDNISGAYQATEYLVRKGHRQIGFVGGHAQAYPSFRERRDGYLKALADFEIYQPHFADCSANRSEIASATLGLITQNKQITGLVCMNDETAITAMYALIEAGFRVPQDISIIGFDDIYLAETVVPSLTTMRVNKQGMGQLAVQLLLNQIFQREGGWITSIFRPSLIERNSVSLVCKHEAVGENQTISLKQ
jgi:LacI family transcriptional regulator